ncbi:hypothetical protein C1H46_031442 [Malus baccata]|uniref:Uncharacterized protein n=1 Tax=Malus baccata TaxID=106549 RepID=A0A540L9L2_MALBA|nr:hypothetical protein C1H46_031442 [Malus baccata]
MRGVPTRRPARPRSKFVDVALGAQLTSASCNCDRGRNTSRPLGFSNLKTRLLFLQSSQIVVVRFSHSDVIRQSKLTPNRHQSVRAQILKPNISFESECVSAVRMPNSKSHLGVSNHKITRRAMRRARYTVTPHFAEEANEMTSINKDPEILLDRDLNR